MTIGSKVKVLETSNWITTLTAYDKNGNITNLARKGQTNINATLFGTMDDLTYSYDAGNKLMKVADMAAINQFGFKDGTNTDNDYAYDINGNLTSDANKGITNIKYNHLNLPTEIKFDNNNNKKINYTYDTGGTKLRKVVNDNGSIITTDYAGGFIYENNQLQFFNQPEGYVEPTVTSSGVEMNYVYQYKDHLGNIRLSYTDSDKDGKVDLVRNGVDIDGDNDFVNDLVEENNYYPFGLEHKGYNNVVTSTNPAQNYTYNGKEKQEELGLNLIDYGWRNYDATLGRFNVIDPGAEIYNHLSPYNYVANNPLLFIDPTGAYIEDGSQAEWNKQTNAVLDRRNEFRNSLKELQSLEGGGDIVEELIGTLTEAIDGLNETINSFIDLETSEQGYSLSTGVGEVGGTTYDSSTGFINIGFGSTSNFVHEVDHAKQFEDGEIAFGTDANGNSATYGQDLGDEISAYRAQFYYDPSSVSGLRSSSTAYSLSTITKSWVRGITTSTGAKPYAVGGSANTGGTNINVNSGKADFIKAYPNQQSLNGLPANFTLKSIPNIIYKK